ncbi:hypothetical protein ACFP3Q_10695 [Nocardioides sp. GCM10027113]|uniref:hypothetical protein n=1 Tax=unclassified Nocardioides TaxID=2615069 RepID=UPI003622491C
MSDLRWPARAALLLAVHLLGLLCLASALPMGGIDRLWAGEAALALLGVTMVLAGVAGYVGSMAGAAVFVVVVGFLGPRLSLEIGPRLASALGPTPDDVYIPLFGVPVLLLPLLMLGGIAGVMARWW